MPAANATPVISVVMAVFNGGALLADAISSILGQSFRDFELIIIDDGSRDGSLQLVRSFLGDPRVSVHAQENRGLAAALNRGVGLSRGAFIARQDHDDISLPERLDRQYRYLLEHPEVGMVGTWATIIDNDGKVQGCHKHPVADADIRTELMRDNPFVHSSVMFRKDLVRQLGGYCEDRALQPPEDYELWTRLALHCRLANIPQCLVRYRETPHGMSRRPSEEFLTKKAQMGQRYLLLLAGGHLPDKAAADLVGYLNHRCPAQPENSLFLLRGYYRVVRTLQSPAASLRYTARLLLKIVLAKLDAILPVVGALKKTRHTLVHFYHRTKSWQSGRMSHVYVVLVGGLGNQLFQYAAALSAARKTGARVKVVHFNYRHDPKRFYHLDCLAEKPAEAGPVSSALVFAAWLLSRRLKISLFKGRLFREASFGFDPGFQAAAPRALFGYFQSHRYFSENWAAIRGKFAFLPGCDQKFRDLAAQIEQCQAVAVHVRRGDYISDQRSLEFHGICGVDYYLEAVRTLNDRHPGAGLTFFVFSDEPERARAEFKDLDQVNYVDCGFGGWQSYLELVLMSKCKHQIIANSSFSWWAAWLNDNPGKTVIAPRRWHADPALHCNDLIPSDWIRL
jgi:glycosyltransferase involved in cell wall biosynthesis